MDLARQAENLWFEWSGAGYTPMGYRSSTYYTEGHIDADAPIVVSGLASLMQREGLVDSLSDGRRAITAASFIVHGYAGTVDGEPDMTICSPDGETFYGDLVEEITPITIVEVVGVAGWSV